MRTPIRLAALVAFALGLYAQTISFGWVNCDDPWLIRDNSFLHVVTLHNLKRVFLDLAPGTRFRLGSEYLPIRDLSVMFDYAWTSSPHVMHATNVLLYALGCGLLYEVLRRWTRDERISFAATLLFLTHPLHVESVAWLSERKGVLSMALMLAAILVFHRFAKRGSLALWFSATFLLVLAVLSKAVAIVGIGLLAVLIFFFFQRDEDDGRLQKRIRIGWFATAFVGCAAFVPALLTAQRMALMAETPEHRTPFPFFLTAKVHALYLEHALLMGNLGISYPLDATTSHSLLIIVGATSALAVLAVAIFALRRRRIHPTLAAACWCWILFFVPVSQLVVRLQNAAADRYMLLPSIGWTLAVALALGRVSGPRLRQTLLAVLVMTQAGVTLAQTRTWKSSRSLYEQALRIDPASIPAHLQLSASFLGEGKLTDAERELATASALRPNDPRVLLHEGLLLLKRGQRERAIIAWRRAIQDPQADQARANLALLLERDRPAEALELARNAVAIQPLRHHNQLTRGIIALNQGLFDEASDALLRACHLEPTDPQTLFNLAVLAVRRRQPTEAIRWLDLALKADPTHARAKSLLRDIQRQTP